MVDERTGEAVSMAGRADAGSGEGWHAVSPATMAANQTRSGKPGVRKFIHQAVQPALRSIFRTAGAQFSQKASGRPLPLAPNMTHFGPAAPE